MLLFLRLSQQSIAHPSYSNNGIPCDIPDASVPLQTLDEDDESDPSFVPGDSELESFSDESSEEEEEIEAIKNQKRNPELKTPVTRRRSKGTPSNENSSLSRRGRSGERVSQGEICVRPVQPLVPGLILKRISKYSKFCSDYMTGYCQHMV